MCTRVIWPDANGAVLVGRNMDFHKDLMTNLWKHPRGVARDDGVKGELTWTSKYGSVIAAAFDIISVDGINEAGLAGHVLWLAESTYGDLDESRPALSQAAWLQYFLDNFATVADAVAWISETDVQVIQMPDPTGGNPPTIHLALDDATGDSAIIEYVDGHARVYHDKSYSVMTNSPTYDQKLELLKRWEGLGGTDPLPGDTVAEHRFARAAYYASRLPVPASQQEAVASMFSVIRNAAQPFRIPDPGKPDASQTIWQTVLDLTNKRYVFESTTRPNIVWVDLDDLDFGEGTPQLKLDLQSKLSLQGGIAGNAAQDFEDDGPMTFLSFELLRQLEHGQPEPATPTAPPDDHDGSTGVRGPGALGRARGSPGCGLPRLHQGRCRGVGLHHQVTVLRHPGRRTRPRHRHPRRAQRTARRGDRTWQPHEPGDRTRGRVDVRARRGSQVDHVPDRAVADQPYARLTG